MTFTELHSDYRIVLADPPWPHYGDPNKNAAAGKHYSLMSLDEIKGLPIRSIMADKAALFLWATGPRLHFAIEAISAWNLHYRGVAYVWVKTRKDGGIIAGQGVPPTFTKPTTEFVLAATTRPRGRPFDLRSLNQQQVVLEPRGRHSAKPPIFRRLITELCSSTHRVELFARTRVSGWDAWGAELDE